MSSCQALPWPQLSTVVTKTCAKLLCNDSRNVLCAKPTGLYRYICDLTVALCLLVPGRGGGDREKPTNFAPLLRPLEAPAPSSCVPGRWLLLRTCAGHQQARRWQSSLLVLLWEARELLSPGAQPWAWHHINLFVLA